MADAAGTALGAAVGLPDVAHGLGGDAGSGCDNGVADTFGLPHFGEE